MTTARIISSVLCGVSTVVASAQVPPPPPMPADGELVKDVQQLVSDLNAHQAKIEQAEIDQETLRLQDDILKTWDKLLDSTRKPSQQQASSNPNQPPQPQNAEQRPQQSNSPPMGESQPRTQNDEQPGEQNGGEPEGTTDSPGQATGQSTKQPADRADAEAREREESRLVQLRQAERERLMKEVWGKLPRRIRQKLLNAADEQYLPEYEDRIQEYFRKLSEPANGSRGD